ncbi:MAG: hypothetical protein IJ710_04295 [Prevotella sp.]|nr:hypothetical protein [Prevotella sp.]
MKHLPEDFITQMRGLLGEPMLRSYLQAFDEETPVSIRLNPQKTVGMTVCDGERVPWCADGWYLPRRPNFTCDPLLHAGCYYVQEAGSMFLWQALGQHLPQRPVRALDLCAAPGGKSTLLRTLLPEGSTLYANEPVHQRASILAENVEKWGYSDCYVTNCYPRDYRKAKMRFDVILCDVPCSGEGMFRKDEATIGEWSPQNVSRCSQLQRDIVSEAWSCLEEGGLLVYSTCTFNTQENEENIRWLLDTYDATVLPVSTEAEWHITGSLLSGFTEPVYRFIPGITRSEGLFLCVLRKGRQEVVCATETGRLRHRNKPFAPQKQAVCVTETKLRHVDAPAVELTYAEAMAYLRREALTLPPDTPRGLVEVRFLGHGLGTVKNIGNRANNLYPKEWRIKTTHIPEEYETILRPA